MNALAQLYASAKTVFTNKDLALIWQENQTNKLNAKISYYVKQKDLIRLTQGIFAKTKEYEVKELATSIYAPSYISFETVLREAGVIFQHYDTLFVASKYAKTLTIDQHPFTFRKLKDSVLYNPLGVNNHEHYSIATLERAFLDMLYLFPNYYFDNLAPINFQQCLALVEIYGNKQLAMRLKNYAKSSAPSITDGKNS